jgi:ribonuclease BN (tRNA processing enzyme)
VLADGVDLLIHDAQYTDDEWDKKSHWGHCTVDYAVLVAKEAGARRLALFHHDPAHGDDKLDALLERARAKGDAAGVGEVISASEGTTVSFERP